jgi:hypothetical protein
MLFHPGNANASSVAILDFLNSQMFKEVQDVLFVRMRRKKSQQKSQAKRLKRS